jgi:curved DNA-binding protein CbpA
VSHPFDLLQLETSYHIDKDLLEKQYQDLMKQMHPDRYSTKPEQDFAIMRSVEINEAFEILKDPIKRAISLLKLQSIDPDHLSMSLEGLSICLEFQENEDYEGAKVMFGEAQNSFAKAWDELDKEALIENFLVMKYLARFLKY